MRENNNPASRPSELFILNSSTHQLLSLPPDDRTWQARASRLISGYERYIEQWRHRMEPALTAPGIDGDWTVASALLLLRTSLTHLERRVDRLPEADRERVRRTLAQFPLTETTDQGAVFSSNFVSGWLPQWRTLLSHLRDVEGARGIEIGSFEGRSAIWFLRNVLTGKDARMCCIDTFDMAFQGAPLVGTSEELHDRFERNLRAYGLRDRVDKLAGKSQELLRTLPLDTYDFAYIDGSHRTDEVLEDTVLVWRLVRIGGVVIFDDYGMSAADDPLIRPGTAIDAFIAMNPARVEVLHRGVQLAVRRLA